MKKLSTRLLVICLTLLLVGCSGKSVPPTNWNEIEIKDFTWLLLPSSFGRKLTGTFDRTLTSIMTALG